MARVVAFVPDLLFGSSVHGALSAAGHELELVGELDPAVEADVVVVDLTVDAADRIERTQPIAARGIPTVAFYSHVESDVRRLADQAGLTLVVPRSRMAREGPALIERVLAGS